MQGSLSRREASDAVSEQGWRFLLGAFCTSVAVASLSEAARVAADAVPTCGPDADTHLRLDLRADRAVLILQPRDATRVTARDVELAHAITAALARSGLRTGPDVGAAGSRSLHLLEIAIDALDIPAIRPFWKAVMGYADEPGAGPTDAVIDPLGQGPAIWFQQMDGPRPQRNRIHLDLSVPHDEAAARMDAALSAGGRLVSDAEAPAFWVLADAEGNEICVTTWQGRDG